MGVVGSGIVEFVYQTGKAAAAVTCVVSGTVTGLAINKPGLGVAVAQAMYTNEDITKIFPNEYDRSDKVKKIRVRSVWLGHGALSAPISAVTGVVTGKSTTHWFVEIETKRGGWYCAQFQKGSSLCLTKHNSAYQVADEGKAAANARGCHKNITTKYGPKSPDDRTMGEVETFMTDYDGQWDVLWNNCQTFGKEFYSWV